MGRALQGSAFFLRVVHAGELHYLAGDDRELRRDFRIGTSALVVEDFFGGVQRSAHRGGPAAQGVHDRSKRRKRAPGCLPAGGSNNASDRAAIQVIAWVIPKVFEQIKRVLHES
jgi:hypothetical protein